MNLEPKMHAIRSRAITTVLGTTTAGSTMRLTIRLLAATLFIMALGLTPASAGPLPAASYSEGVNAGGGYTESSGTYGTITQTQSVPGEGSASATATISGSGLSLSAFYDSCCLGGPPQAIASYTYDIEILGPAGNVTLDITGSGGVTADESPAGIIAQSDLAAYISIVAPFGGGGVVQACAGNTGTCPGITPTGISFNIDGAYTVATNTPIVIQIGGRASCGFGVCDDTATAGVIQPIFTIDPDVLNLDQYSIIYSAGLPPSSNGVPEPGTLGILSAALGGLSLLRRRRRR